MRELIAFGMTLRNYDAILLDLALVEPEVVIAAAGGAWLE